MHAQGARRKLERRDMLMRAWGKRHRQHRTRRGNRERGGELKHRQSPPLGDALHGRSQASPRDQWLQSGDGCVGLSDLLCPEQGDGKSEAVKETVKAEDRPSGRKAARNRGLHREEATTGGPGRLVSSPLEKLPPEREALRGRRAPSPFPSRLPKRFLARGPDAVWRTADRAGHGRRRREEASQRHPPWHTTSGIG